MMDRQQKVANRHSGIKLLALTLLLGSMQIPAQGMAADTAPNGRMMATSPKVSTQARYVEGELLVKLKAGVSASDMQAALGAGQALQIKKQYPVMAKVLGSEYLLLRSEARTTDQLLAAMQGDPLVQSASPNYFRRADSTPNDPSFSVLWGLHNTGQSGGTIDADVDAPEAWDITTGSKWSIVVVIDTGVAYDHEDLAANMWTNPGEIAGNGVDDDGNGYVDDVYGIDTVNNDSNPMDDAGHGSHCAGTIAATGNNSKGITGVNWTARIMALKFLSSLGSGTDGDAIEAISYVIDQKKYHGQNVVAINASWGGGDNNPLLSDVIQAAGDAGIVFCASAGNDAEDTDALPHYPSSYPLDNIISVASTTRTDALSSFSNYGLTSVDLGAPGSSIYSTVSYFDPAAANIFFDNMESGFGNWSTGGTNNSWAISSNLETFPTSWGTKSFGTPPSGSSFLSDSPGVNYLAGTDSWVGVNSDIDLSGHAGEPVYFSLSSAFVCDFWWGETAKVEISANSGTTWTTLFNLSDWYYNWVYWGFASDAVTIPEAYKTAHFRFRFHFTANGTDDQVDNGDAGWVIDDVGIGTNLVKEYATYSGTSMATPHVAGAVALLAAKFPTESVAGRKDRILNNIDELPALDNMTVTGGRLNVYKALIAPSTEDFPWIFFYPAFTRGNR